MIIEEPKPKTRKRSNPEHKLQAEMVKWYAEKFPDNRGALIATFQETPDAIKGGIMKSLGLVASVSDLLYFCEDQFPYIIGIEVKAKGTYHSVEHLRSQAKWLIRYPKYGWFCDNIESFGRIIMSNGMWGGIDPRKILEKLENEKRQKILWE
jgi:hypothetical protein